jgi:hypothetical protein
MSHSHIQHQPERQRHFFCLVRLSGPGAWPTWLDSLTFGSSSSSFLLFGKAKCHSKDALLSIRLCFELSEQPAPPVVVEFSALETCVQDEESLASESFVVTIVIGRDNYPASSINDKLLRFRQYNALYTKAQELTLKIVLEGMLISGVVEFPFAPISIAQGRTKLEQVNSIGLRNISRIQLFYEIYLRYCRSMRFAL